MNPDLGKQRSLEHRIDVPGTLTFATTKISTGAARQKEDAGYAASDFGFAPRLTHRRGGATDDPSETARGEYLGRVD